MARITWNVPDPDNVLLPIRRAVKVYAVEHDLTLAQALAELIMKALEA